MGTNSENSSRALQAVVLVLLLRSRKRIWSFLKMAGQGNLEDVVNRFGGITGAALVVTLFFLSRKEQVTREDNWVTDEILQMRKELRRTMIQVEEDLTKENGKVDVLSLLRRVTQVADCCEHDEILSAGVMLSARSLVFEMNRTMNELKASKGNSIQQQGDHEMAVYLSDLISHSNWVFETAKLSCPDVNVSDVLGNTCDKSRQFLTSRRWVQAKKTVALFRDVKSPLPMIIVATVLSSFSSMLEAYKQQCMARLISSIYTKLSQASNHRQSWSLGMISILKSLFIAEILSELSFLAAKRAESLGTEKFILDIKSQMFSSLVAQDMAFFELNDTYSIRESIQDVGQTLTTLFKFPVNAMSTLSAMVTNLTMMYVASKKLTFIIFGLLLAKHGVDTWTKAQQLVLLHKTKTTNKYLGVSGFRDIMQTIVQPEAMKTLKCYGRELQESQQYSDRLKMVLTTKSNSAEVSRWFRFFRSALSKFIDIGSLFLASRLVLQGEMHPGSLATFSSTAHRVVGLAHEAYDTWEQLLECLDSIEGIYDLLHRQSSIGILHPPIETMTELTDWSIEFDDVSFSYPTKPDTFALKNASLCIPQGSKIGILGPSGCGKSTILALLLRLYDPAIGEIKLGGQPLRNYNPMWLRKQMALVSQNVHLPTSTLRGNLLYGVEGSSDPELENRIPEALKLASCYDLFMDKTRFPKQLDSHIGFNGSSLSGGEKQRLCLARALLAMPKILLLDEATSALDELSQFQIQEAIQYMFEKSGKQMTTVTIAHRLSNFRHVDSLFILDQGAVVEQGTPEALEKLPNGMFANFLTLSENFMKK